MLDLTFRKVDKDVDILTVERLAREIWPDYYIPIIGADQVDYMLKNLQSVAAIKGQIEEGYCYYLIVYDGKTVGYLSVLPKPELGQLFLSKLYLLPAQRGQGLGRLAVIFLAGLAREARLPKIALMVSKRNSAAISFYERRGFKNVGPVVKDIGGGFVMDDWSMELELKNV
jgi:GNAT superfamily N-acetyltransferase